MTIEHIAYQVAKPQEVAAWYVEHLGFSIKRVSSDKPNAHFLADDSGKVMVEVYNNPKVSVPDYASMDPLILHLAFTVEGEVAAEVARLVEAGASIVDDTFTSPLGDHLAMLRDPWAFPIQLCRRAKPMV